MPRPSALPSRHLGPPPQPGFSFVPSPEFRLSPRWGWEWGGAVGEVRRESFRCQQPSPITGAARGAAGRGEGPGLLGFLPCRGAARSAVPVSRAAVRLTAFARTRALCLTERGQPEAAPPGKKAGAQQDGWVWIVVLFFLFVAFLGTKKKAQPFTPLHLHLSRPETQPQWLGGMETAFCLIPHNWGWVGWAFLLGPTPRL